MNKKTIEFAFMFANMDEESRTNILLDLIDSQQKPEESESKDAILTPKHQEYINE